MYVADVPVHSRGLHSRTVLKVDMKPCHETFDSEVSPVMEDKLKAAIKDFQPHGEALAHSEV